MFISKIGLDEFQMCLFICDVPFGMQLETYAENTSCMVEAIDIVHEIGILHRNDYN